MTTKEYNEWIINFYKERGWYDYDPFIRTCFLTEEVGEISRVVRSLEIGRDRPDENLLDQSVLHNNLKEELADVLDNVLILADKYSITLDEIMAYQIKKLEQRFEE